MLKRTAFVVTPLLLMGLLAWAVFKDANSVEPGKAAPPFSLTSFTGERVTLESHTGKIVLLNFWASWCLPCRDEAPHLEKIWKEYAGRGVVVIGINADDLEKDARKYVSEFQITFPNVRDNAGKTKSSYAVTAFPESFFISRDGTLIFIERGPMSEEVIRERLDRMLASDPLGG
ncbi:MAG TPA: redoxin domain-containing protein [Actinomycetota bacterium]|nr:redoxin domain-containing protein [Actinomycetota bacterium]